MPVSNSERFECLRQRLVVILRVGARAWHGSDIGDERHLCVLQQICKFINWTRRVANSVERIRHAQNALVFIERGYLLDAAQREARDHCYQHPTLKAC